MICISVCHYGGRQSFQCGAALKMMMMRPYEYVQCIFCSCTIFHGRGGVLLPAFAKARHGSSSRGSYRRHVHSQEIRSAFFKPIRISNLLLDFVRSDWWYVNKKTYSQHIYPRVFSLKKILKRFKIRNGYIKIYLPVALTLSIVVQRILPAAT